MRQCFGFFQHSHYHRYDVYEHIVRAVGSAPNELVLRRAMLFHDIGKPSMFTIDERGEGHFKGHAAVSAKIAEDVMKRLKYDNSSIKEVRMIIAAHSDKISSDKQIKRMVSKMGLEGFLMLLEAKKADNLAKNDFVYTENEEFDRFAETARRLVAEDSCLKISQLAVNGNDMLALGLRDRQIGDVLNILLEMVIDGKVENSRAELLRTVKYMKNRI